jgi:glycosyltransferase involved in cell wall biosynthesis
VIEAMATGTPVVASDIAAHREISGGLATLVRGDDVDGWAEALTRLPAAGTGGDRSDALRRHARSFTWKACAEAHIRAYSAAAEAT